MNANTHTDPVATIARTAQVPVVLPPDHRSQCRKMKCQANVITVTRTVAVSRPKRSHSPRDRWAPGIRSNPQSMKTRPRRYTAAVGPLTCCGATRPRIMSTPLLAPPRPMKTMPRPTCRQKRLAPAASPGAAVVVQHARTARPTASGTAIQLTSCGVTRVSPTANHASARTRTVPAASNSPVGRQPATLLTQIGIGTPSPIMNQISAGTQRIHRSVTHS